METLVYVLIGVPLAVIWLLCIVGAAQSIHTGITDWLDIRANAWTARRRQREKRRAGYIHQR